MSSFHIVDHSPWPLYISLSLITLIIGDVFTGLLGLITSCLIITVWLRDIIREGKEGNHTKIVQKGITLGYIIFLITEIMLFFSFFWSYFHSSLSPTASIGLIWPPIGIDAIQFTSLPLLGSLLLLSSGFFVTLSHHAFLASDKSLCLIHGIITLILGISFTCLQATEYYFSTFTIADSIFGSVFYMTTGLHGIHVILGIFGLIISYIRIFRDHLTLEHHLGFEFAIFYYHLVDIIWLFVFITFYWWGS
jgi:cytochrome c oxidase subunit 3